MEITLPDIKIKHIKITNKSDSVTAINVDALFSEIVSYNPTENRSGFEDASSADNLKFLNRLRILFCHPRQNSILKDSFQFIAAKLVFHNDSECIFAIGVMGKETDFSEFSKFIEHIQNKFDINVESITKSECHQHIKSDKSNIDTQTEDSDLDFGDADENKVDSTDEFGVQRKPYEVRKEGLSDTQTIQRNPQAVIEPIREIDYAKLKFVLGAVAALAIFAIYFITH